MLDMNDEKLKRGYIRLFRCIDEWEWYTDITVKVLYMHILIKANHSEKIWRGVTIQRGSFITSLENLSSESGLTKQQVRTALKKLESTQEITRSKGGSYTLITVKNWNLYQDSNTITNKQITQNQHRDNTEVTTTNNVNNDNNINNNKKENDKKLIKDPNYSPEIVSFLNTFKRVCKKPVALSPDERIKLMGILNDLIINQNFTLNEITNTVCKNFNNLNFDKEKINVGINWLLKDSNFYGVLNGQNTKKTIETHTTQAPEDRYSLGATETYKGVEGWTL